MVVSAGVDANGRRTEAVPPPEQRLTYSYGDLLTLAIPPARPLVAGLLDEGSGNIWGGPPNVGKSWLVLTLARAVAGGTPWLGHFPTQQGAVLIVDEESHLPGVQARIKMLQADDPFPADLPLHFAIGRGLRLDAASAAELDADLGRLKPALVILDSLTRVHGANENDAGQMADVFANAKRLMRQHGAAFLFTDHTRKLGVINVPEEMLRGSTEKRAWPDGILAAEPVRDDPTALTVHHTKARHGRRLDPFTVKLDIDEHAGTARLLHAGEAKTDTATRGADIINAIHAIKHQLGDDGTGATELAAWLGCSPSTVERHAKALAGAGLVATRKATPGAAGGRPRTVYDVTEGPA